MAKRLLGTGLAFITRRLIMRLTGGDSGQSSIFSTSALPVTLGRSSTSPIPQLSVVSSSSYWMQSWRGTNYRASASLNARST